MRQHERAGGPHFVSISFEAIASVLSQEVFELQPPSCAGQKINSPHILTYHQLRLPEEITMIATSVVTMTRSLHNARRCFRCVIVAAALVSAALTRPCFAFGPFFGTNGCRAVIPNSMGIYYHQRISPEHKPPISRLHSNNGRDDGGTGNRFDISKPTFDLLSFRLIRSDALLRYNSLNQSEPLRINLFFLSTISLFGYPFWCESVTGEVPTLSSSIGAAGAGVACAFLFWRERSRRSNQLKRMEKELNAGSLEVRLPVNTAISSVRPVVCLKDLRGKRRVLAIQGSKEQLQSSGVLTLLCVLRRRLIQSQTLVVLLPTDATNEKTDLGLDPSQIGDAMWLSDPIYLYQWEEYFHELVENSDSNLAWFALNFNGRSIASGLGEPPRLLELLGQQLQPTEILQEMDEAELQEGIQTQIARQILESQRQFYKILTDCDDETKMQSICNEKAATEVDEVLTRGGRIDSWSSCLDPRARPSGMVISGSDVFVASDTLAYSTCIEHPSNAGIEGATLLAVQRWGRESNMTDDWKLELHQTIPWSCGSRAGGTLRCDFRGCVALARTPDSRTFGGLIG
ncbi:hypothetical protein HJC23_012034 [Cyclotella cryptica]|uniref:Uncharacterized protein n=1 Tax=Cyclotella cryptica TaxID=29204 RepID=A0ABD3PQN2_9STRA